MRKPLKQQRRFVALIVILIVTWGLRAYNLGAQELRGDEAGSWSFVVHESGPTALVERIIRDGDPHPPLHHWLLQVWVRVFGESEWALRTPSAFLSLILVALVYQLGARAVSNEIGLVAAVITALHPFQIWLAQDVRHMYQLSIIFVLLATLRLPGLLQGRRLDWWIYVLSGLLAMYSHYYSLFGLMAHGVYVFVHRENNRKRWILASFAVALLLSPWVVVILPVYAREQLADPAMIPPMQYLSRVAADFALGPVVAPVIGLSVAGFGFVLVVYGAASLSSRSKSRSWNGLLIAWPLLTLAGIYAITTRRGTFNSFYFLVAFPAVHLLLAVGWHALRRHQGAMRAGIVALLAAGLVAYALSNYFFVPQWSKNRGLRDVAGILRAQARDGDVFIANFPDPAQDYYLRELMLARAMLPEEAQADRVVTRAALQQLAQQYQRLWFVPMEAMQWDPDATVLDLLDHGYVREERYRVGKLELLRYASDPASVPTTREVGAVFAAGPELERVHVAVNSREAREYISAGDFLRVSLLWSAPEISIEEDYIVFVHLLDSNGMLLASHDGSPATGSRPTSTWQPGEHIIDVHAFRLPEVLDSELFTLSVGLYSRDTQERQMVVGGDDSVAVFEYTLESSKYTSE